METIIYEINEIDSTVLSQAGWMDEKGYLNRVYRFLNAMKPGSVYPTSKLATPETKRLFVLVVQLYQLEVKGNCVNFIDSDFNSLIKN